MRPPPGIVITKFNPIRLRGAGQKVFVAHGNFQCSRETMVPWTRPDTTFHLSQPPELFARIDQEPEVDEFGESIVMTTIGSVVNWGRKNAIWPMSFGLACCAIEMMSMIGSRFDISRFGAEVMRGSPRQSDLHDHRRPRLE